MNAFNTDRIQWRVTNNTVFIQKSETEDFKIIAAIAELELPVKAKFKKKHSCFVMTKRIFRKQQHMKRLNFHRKTDRTISNQHKNFQCCRIIDPNWTWGM